MPGTLIWETEVEPVRNPGLTVSVGAGPSSGDANVTASLPGSWMVDGEVSPLTVLVGQRSFLNIKLLQMTHFQNF